MRIVIGEGSCGVAAGAAKVHSAIEALMNDNESFSIGSTGCIGMCFLEPIIDLYDDEKNRLNEKLERKFSKKIIANYEIKQEILAGLIVQYGNTVIDFSLATKFKNMKKTLI